MYITTTWGRQVSTCANNGSSPALRPEVHHYSFNCYIQKMNVGIYELSNP